MAKRSDEKQGEEKHLTSGQRLVVFSIKESKSPGGGLTSVWIRAGSAWVNRDGSINVYLDVLPLDGKLHLRELPDGSSPSLLTSNPKTETDR